MAIAKQLCWLVSTAAVLIAVGVGASRATYAILDSREAAIQAHAIAQSQRRIADLKSRGFPIDFESLRTLYDSRTSPDDAAAWLEITRYLGSDEFTLPTNDVYPIGHDLAPRTPERVMNEYFRQRIAIEKNAALVSRIHKLASHKTPVRFNIDYRKWQTDKNDFIFFITSNWTTPWIALMGEHDNKIDKLMKLLTCELIVAVANKDPVQIQESLKAQFNVLSTFQGEDLLGDCVNMCNLQLMVFRNVKTAIECNVLNREQVEEILSELQTMPNVLTNWPKVVQSQRAWLLVYLQGQQPLDYFSAKPGTQTRLGTSPLDIISFLDYMDRYEQIDWTSSVAAMDTFIEINHEIQSESHPPPYRDYRDWWVWKTSLSGWNDHAGDMARCASERNQAIIGCALRLYQMKHAVFPQILYQLADVGLDPNNYLCAVDQLFGYELDNDVSYLWGPTQLGSGYRFDLSPTNPKNSQTTHDYVRAQWDENLWTMPNQLPNANP